MSSTTTTNTNTMETTFWAAARQMAASLRPVSLLASIPEEEELTTSASRPDSGVAFLPSEKRAPYQPEFDDNYMFMRAEQMKQRRPNIPEHVEGGEPCPPAWCLVCLGRHWAGLRSVAERELRRSKRASKLFGPREMPVGGRKGGKGVRA